jgi:sugar phosphate isomerase/epimerase
MEYALSTMWGVKRYPTLGPFFTEAEAVGFTCFELNHGVDSSMLEGMKGRKIQSIHEPCPADISTAVLKQNDWLVSSLDEINRRKGVVSIKRSIDLAVATGATAVVIHPGKVNSELDTEDRMRELYEAGLRNSGEYKALLEANIEARAQAVPANLAQTVKSLEELAFYAQENGITLGLENRYHYHEIPSPAELSILLRIAPPGVIGFWYDAGHAETMSRMGFFPHEEWLDVHSSRIVGAHLHDVDKLEDHRIPGEGTLPWSDILGRIPTTALRTCEFRNFYSPVEIGKGRRFLEALGV